MVVGQRKSGEVGGVIGVLPGIIGCLQANEVIKVITGLGEPLSGKLFLFDALTLNTQTISFDKDPNLEAITELIDYEAFCGLKSDDKAEGVREITVEELRKMQQDQVDFQLIDVRETHEYASSNLGGILIPLATIEGSLALISREKPVVIHCRSGARSARAIELLSTQHGYSNLLNLKGGILAWQELS